jgi:DNA-directed RNA polymerase specialized sigma24 family protein
VSMLGSVVEAAFDAQAPQLKAFALAAVRDDDVPDDLVQTGYLARRHRLHRRGPSRVTKDRLGPPRRRWSTLAHPPE